MNHKRNLKLERKKAAFFLWTIRNQGFLSYHIHVYMWSAVAIILLFTLAGAIPLHAALQAIFFGGLVICGLIWVLIERRRSWLLQIEDPSLRKTAHNVMLTYLAGRLTGSDANRHFQ